MSDYAPTSRRPIAAGFRRTAAAATRFCVRLGIHPDAISYLSMVAALTGALCFWKSGEIRWLLIVAPLFCYLRLWFNMLDGMVAVAAGKADVIIFAGIAHSGLMNPIFGYWAAIFAALTAYVGLFGQALGVQRQFGGIMAKPWRMVALHVGAWLTFVLCRSCVASIQRIGSFTILDWTCLVVIAGCLETMVVRLKRIMGALQNKLR
jgi:hypothetical protein